MKFCPNCGSIINVKRVSGQLMEFCNCENKKEPKKQKVTIKTSPKQKVTLIREKKPSRKNRFVTIEESNFKPKRDPSIYQKLPLKLRFSTNPPTWLKGKTAKRVITQTNQHYERFYRDLEDFFKNSSLLSIVLLTPNSTFSDFSLVNWGLATLSSRNEFILWYSGTKLNDKASWDSKVIEKKSDVFLPFDKYLAHQIRPVKIDFDRISLLKLCELLLNTWDQYKKLNPEIVYNSRDIEQIYEKFRNNFL